MNKYVFIGAALTTLAAVSAANAQQMGRAPIDVRGGAYELNRAALIESMRDRDSSSSSSASGGGSTSVGPTTVYNFNSTAVDNLNQITQTLSGGATGNLNLGVKQTGNNSTQSASTSGSVSESLNQILHSGAAQQ